MSAVLKSEATEKKIEVKTYFQDVSYTGKELLKRDLWDWEKVVDAKIVTIDEAKKMFARQHKNQSVLSFLQRAGHNAVVVAQTSVLPEKQRQKLRHPDRAIKAILAPTVQ